MSELLTMQAERKLWFDGPNYTADAVVIDPERERIFLIQRKDTGQWALPGGFVDPEDASPYETAIREASEEGNLTLSGSAPLVFRGIVDDPRNTEEAWIETSAYLFLTERTDTVEAGDDAKDIDWPRIDGLTPKDLYASHAMIIERALEQMRGQQLFETLASADTALRIDAGHMEYDKAIIARDAMHVFAKSHNPERFSDPDKAARSYAYLEKEAFTMAHLRQHGFTGLPRQSALHQNTLAMDALRPEDGWQWRADASSVDVYVRDAAAAFAHLATMPVPADSFDIDPSHTSFLAEGWWAFDETAPSLLEEKTCSFMDRLSSSSQDTAAQLLGDIPALHRAGSEPYHPGPFVFCHHDVRQSNLAWHPNHGTKLVDWSWAGVGEVGSDITSLLIDLHKSGHDITPYKDLINPRHCLTLMGFWLGHSTWPHRGDDTVRFQQFLSALSAYEILQNN